MRITTVLPILIMAYANPGHAAFVHQVKSYSAPTGIVSSDLFTFNSFDVSLGILDRVTYSLQGNMTIRSPATPNLLPVGPFGTLQPVPYNYLIRTVMDVSSLAGFDFDLGSKAEFFFSGTSLGVGDPLFQVRAFSLEAKFDEISDLSGFAALTTSGMDIPPTMVYGSRGEFEENLITSSSRLQFQMLNTWSVIFDSGPAAVITPMGDSSGFVTLRYDYTPYEDKLPVSEVPVPGGLWLLVSALTGLSAFSKGGAYPMRLGSTREARPGPFRAFGSARC